MANLGATDAVSGTNAVVQLLNSVRPALAQLGNNLRAIIPVTATVGLMHMDMLWNYANGITRHRASRPPPLRQRGKVP